MKKLTPVIIISLLLIFSASASKAGDSTLTGKIDKILKEGPANDNYHITAKQLFKWMKAGRNDFFVVDVRMPPDHEKWGRPEYGRIPGSIYIPYTDMFEPENLKRLPKDKKIILVGHMSVYENYLVVPLRLKGYDAYILLMGMSGWQKGYPAVGHVNMLIKAAKKMNFPVEK